MAQLAEELEKQRKAVAERDAKLTTHGQILERHEAEIGRLQQLLRWVMKRVEKRGRFPKEKG